MATYRILALDGGGIRGLFTARVLERLVASRPSLLSKVDLIAGTSTGGILALGLAAGRTPKSLGDLYRAEAKRIFDDSLWDDITDLGSAVGADYRHKGLKQVLEREFAGMTLGSLGKRVLVPAFDLDAPAKGSMPRSWRPKFFHNYPGPDSDGAWSVVDVALATSSAPTYFPSHKGYVDGGVVANNPSMAAVAQALSPGGANAKLDETVVLSISTGTDPKFTAGDVDWGWGQWARPLVSLMIGGVMGVAQFQCRQLLGDRFHRVDDIFGETVELDAKKTAKLNYLEKRAQQVDLTAATAWLGAMQW